MRDLNSKTMRFILGTGCVWFLAATAALNGQGKAVARNVDISIQQNKAYIHYEIAAKKASSLHRIELMFLDENYNLVTPSRTTGDIGLNIGPGEGKTIIWDITHDLELLGTEIKPVIFVDGASKQYNSTGGPRNALLSVLIPGLGDYFVADHRMMTFKPYMRTVTSLGLIGLGIYLGNQRYLAEGYYELTLKANSWRYEGEDRFYDRYIEGSLQYEWFKGDKEVFIALGAAVWAADIIWVLARGSNNMKFRKATTRESRFHLGYVPGGAAFQYTCTF